MMPKRDKRKRSDQYDDVTNELETGAGGSETNANNAPNAVAAAAPQGSVDAATASAVGAAASSGPGFTDRRAAMAEVARARAEHFARGGGGLGPSNRSNKRSRSGVAAAAAAPVPAQASNNDDDAEEEEEAAGEGRAAGGGGGNRDRERARRPSHWPGPFATARQLLAGRDAARAAREADEPTSAAALINSASSAAAASSSGLAAGAAGGGADARTAPRRRHVGAVGAEPEAEPSPEAEQAEAALRGLLRLPEPADYVADWSPAIPPSQLLLGLTQQQPQQPQSSDSRSSDSDSEGDGKASGPAGASPGPGAKAGRPSGAAAAAAAAAAAGVRTVRAVAGPSGVRTSVPSLAVLCMEAMAAHLKEEHVIGPEGLGPLMPNARRAFAEAVCRRRAMDGHAFSLFASPDVDELVVPDCAGVDEHTLVTCLSQCFSLTRIELGHCGRCLTDRVAKTLLPASATAHLARLSIGGSYTLTDGGLEALLSRCPRLTSLRLAGCPVLTGAFLVRLPQLLPQLQVLELEGLPFVGDPEMRGKPRKTGTAAAAAPDAGAAAAAAAAATASSQTYLDLSLDSDADNNKAPEPSSSAAAAAAAGDEPLGGVLALQSLEGLTLSQLPEATDAFLCQLLTLRGPQMTRLKVDRCPKVTDKSLLALAATAGVSQPVIAPAHPQFSSSAEAGSSTEEVAAPEAVLQPLPLKRLELEGLLGINEAGLIAIARATGSIQVLSLRRCVNASDAGVLALVAANAPNLRSVNMSGVSAMSDAPLVALAKAAKLPTPSAYSYYAASSAPGDQGTLVELDVSMCRGISSAGLGQVVDAAPGLRRLLVWGCTQLDGVFYNGHLRALAAAIPHAMQSLSTTSDVDGDVDVGTQPTGASPGPGVPTAASASKASASGAAAKASRAAMEEVVASAARMAPLCVYGRAGDVLPAPDYYQYAAVD